MQQDDNRPDRATESGRSGDPALAGSDTDILRPRVGGAPGGAVPLERAQVGAAVYSSDGEEVAIVVTQGADHVGLSAGQPSRPMDVDASQVAAVSADGMRLDLRLSAAEVERLVGADQPGYAHLEAQRLHKPSPAGEQQVSDSTPSE